MLKNINSKLINVENKSELSKESDVKDVIQSDPKLRGLDIKQAMHFLKKWDKFCSS